MNYCNQSLPYMTVTRACRSCLSCQLPKRPPTALLDFLLFCPPQCFFGSSPFPKERPSEYHHMRSRTPRGPWTRNSEGPQTNGCMFGVHFDGFPLDYRGPWTRNSEGPQTNGCMFGVHFGWVPPGLSGPMDKEQGGAQTNGCMFGVHFGWVPLGLSGPMDKEQGGAPKPMVVCLGFILDGLPLDYRGPWTRNSEGPQTNGCMFGVHFGWVPLGLSGPMDKEQGGPPNQWLFVWGSFWMGSPWTIGAHGQGTGRCPQTNGCMFGVHFGWVPLVYRGPSTRKQ